MPRSKDYNHSDIVSASNEARRRAKATQRTQYVIHVGEDIDGPYAITDDAGFATFYIGTSDRSIMYEAHP